MNRIEQARELRRNLTPQEACLWRTLRNRRFRGYKFRRQHPIGPFILDFYSPSLTLALEIDGRQHEDPAMREYDDARTEYLQRFGIAVVRIPNILFRGDTRILEDQIEWAIESSPSSGLRPPSPRFAGRRGA